MESFRCRCSTAVHNQAHPVSKQDDIHPLQATTSRPSDVASVARQVLPHDRQPQYLVGAGPLLGVEAQQGVHQGAQLGAVVGGDRGVLAPEVSVWCGGVVCRGGWDGCVCGLGWVWIRWQAA